MTLTGSILCPGYGPLSVTVSEVVGRKLIQGTGSTYVNCWGVSTTFSVTTNPLGGTLKFAPGQASESAIYYDYYYGGQITDASSVRLK